MPGRLSARALKKDQVLTSITTPLTEQTYQTLQMPVEVNSETVMIEITIDLTSIHDET